MNKRGDWTLLQTITILAGILVAILLVTIVYKFTSQQGAENDFLAKDSAMLSDAILSTPGDVQVAYPIEIVKGDEIKGYARLRADVFSVFNSKPELEGESLHHYYFVPRADINVIDKDLPLSVLYFIKADDNFTITTAPIMGGEIE